MRTISLSLVLGLLVLSVSYCHGQESPRAIIEKAIKARGGLETITKPGASYRKVKGEFPDRGYKFIGDGYSESRKNRLKLVHNTIGTDDNEQRIMVINGDKGWFVLQGTLITLDERAMARMKRARFADRVASLTVLMKEKGYKLAHLGESKIKEKTALGIKVSYEGQPDMNLYFDKHSGLLIKTRQQFFDSDENREVVHELYYSEFKAFDPLAKEITALKKANISVKPQDLVKYVREQTPTPEIKDKIQQYIGQLGSPVFRIRIKATAELEKIGTPATPYLAKVLDSVDPEVSRRATACLANIETKGNGHLLLSAVRVISAHNPEGAVPALLNYVPWSEGVLNQEIRSALLALRKSDKANKAELLKALENKHPIVKQAAAAALGHDGGTFAKLPGRRLFPTGVQFATRCEMYRDGKLHMILQTLEVNYYNGLNDSLFAQPDLTTP